MRQGVFVRLLGITVMQVDLSEHVQNLQGVGTCRKGVSHRRKAPGIGFLQLPTIGAIVWRGLLGWIRQTLNV